MNDFPLLVELLWVVQDVTQLRNHLLVDLVAGPHEAVLCAVHPELFLVDVGFEFFPVHGLSLA